MRRVVYADLRIIPQHYTNVGRGHMDWIVIPTSALKGDLRRAEVWRRLHPLRLNVIADAKHKSGVATSRAEFIKILDEIVGKRPAQVPYKVGARMDHNAGDKPHVFEAA